MKLKLFFIIFLAIVVLAPMAVQAQSLGFPSPCNLDNAFRECTFERIFGLYDHGESLFSKVYYFIIFYLAVPLATLSIVVAGIMYATSAADPGQRSKAKKILTYAVIGMVITLGSYLIVKMIVNPLVKDNDVGNVIKLD